MGLVIVLWGRQLGGKRFYLLSASFDLYGFSTTIIHYTVSSHITPAAVDRYGLWSNRL